MLVVAPHGGSSTADLLSGEAVGRRGNDLHTAELARDLAAALDGSLLVNESVDRNQLDLNRVTEVVERAPWFLAELERQVERILSTHRSALVLVVHGWHVEQARCDLGIGAVLENASSAYAKPDVLTAAPEFVAGSLESFRRRLAGEGILATYGERWPAAHRNNVMRLFRRRPDERGFAPGLAARAAEGRVDAVQLELGSPLRWPGELREALIAGAVRTFGSQGSDPGVVGPTVLEEAVGDDAGRPTARMVQAFDGGCGGDGLGLVAGAIHLPGKDVGARLQLFPGGQRMAIFVGHGRRGPALGVPDLYFHETPEGFDVRFDGRLLAVDDAAAYFEQEITRADARLVRARFELTFREAAGGLGALEGKVEYDGEPYEVSTTGFGDARGLTGRGTRHGTQLVASFASAPALRLYGPGDEGSWRVSRFVDGAWVETEAWGRIEHRGDAWHVDLDQGFSATLSARTRGAVLRPVGPREYVHTTFAVVRLRLGSGEQGTGFFEQRRAL